MPFGEFAVAVLNTAPRDDECKGIDVVFDTYQKMSVTNSERPLHEEESVNSCQIVRKCTTQDCL